MTTVTLYEEARLSMIESCTNTGYAYTINLNNEDNYLEVNCTNRKNIKYASIIFEDPIGTLDFNVDNDDEVTFILDINKKSYLNSYESWLVCNPKPRVYEVVEDDSDTLYRIGRCTYVSFSNNENLKYIEY